MSRWVFFGELGALTWRPRRFVWLRLRQLRITLALQIVSQGRLQKES